MNCRLLIWPTFLSMLDSGCVARTESTSPDRSTTTTAPQVCPGECVAGDSICDGAQPCSCLDGHFRPSGPSCDLAKYDCDDTYGTAGCSCKIGATICDEATGKQGTCMAGANGLNDYAWDPCGAGEICSTDLGVCTPVADTCTPEGFIICSENNDLVLRCQIDTSTKHLTLVPVVDCSEKTGFDHCAFATSGDPNQWCANVCGGTTPLLSDVCDTDPAHDCGLLFCNEATGMLEGDHSACLAASASCLEDRECKSCNCTDDGVCSPNPLPCSPYTCP